MERQVNECKTKTESGGIFNVTHNRAIRLNVLTRAHTSLKGPGADVDGAVIIQDDNPKEYL